MSDLVIEIRGIIRGELSQKEDKNGSNYYHGKIDCDDGNHAFFFFKPSYDLSMRLENLKDGNEITLKGSGGKRKPVVFVAVDFYLESD